MNSTILLQLILDCGAKNAAVITQNQLVLNASFLDICEKNQCGMYGRCWVCPPATEDIHILMKRVSDFKAGILYQTIALLEDSFDIEGMQAAAHDHALLGQRIETVLAPHHLKTFHMSCGGCHLCTRCAKQDQQPCRFPGKPLLPLEVCGIDVYSTTKSTPLRYINGQNTVTYFGLLLFQENGYVYT